MNNLNKKPIVLFFARDYQSQFFTSLVSEKYDSIYVTLNKREKKRVEEKGGRVVACLEEDYENLPETEITFPYLEYSIGADRFIKGHSHNERLTILKKCVSFWRNIYKTYQPGFVINEIVALEISEIMLLEARRHSVQYLAFGAFSVGKSFYWHANPFHSSMPDEIQAIQPSEQHFIDAKNYINQLKHGDVDNPYLKELKGNKELSRLYSLSYALLVHIYIRLFIKGKVIRQICYANSISYFRDEIVFYFKYILKGDKYDDVKAIDVDKEKFFYPLHFEPEATLFYMSTYYENQYALIENLLKCLAENQVLMVKEHPAQPGVLMQKKYKKLKERFPNVAFIKADVSSKEMIVSSKAVITLVSTAGFEALALDKPVILLGKIYYDSFDGVNHCKTFEEVYNLVRGYKPFNKGSDFEELLAKLISMQNTGNPWPHSDLYTKENIAGVVKAIEDRIANERIIS